MRSIARVAVAVSVSFVLAGCTSHPAAAATVEGSPVSAADLERATGVFQSLYDVQKAPCGTSAGAGDPVGAACTRFALGVLVQLRAAESYATAHTISVSESDVQATADRFEGNFAKGALSSALAANSVTREDFLQIVRESVIQDAVAKALAVATVGEADLRAQYDAGIANYTVVQVDHILVKTKAEAERIHAQVTAPGFTETDFQTLAATVSIDPSAQTNSGSLGSAVAATYTAAFRDAVLTMEPGQISDPVHSEFGWHVIWMVNKQVTPYATARDQLLQSAKGPAFADFIRARVTAGSLTVDPRYGRFDPTTLTVVPIRSTDPSAGSSAAPVNASTTPSG